jgi:hypothetical protein
MISDAPLTPEEQVLFIKNSLTEAGVPSSNIEFVETYWRINSGKSINPPYERMYLTFKLTLQGLMLLYHGTVDVSTDSDRISGSQITKNLQTLSQEIDKYIDKNFSVPEVVKTRMKTYGPRVRR